MSKTYSLKDIIAIKEIRIIRFGLTKEMQDWKLAFNLYKTKNKTLNKGR